MTLLVLGGTTEGRELASALVEAGVPVISSLAGATSGPRLPAGEVRIGGFGGAAGLEAFLRERRITAVVDATHPFAARISANAGVACAAAGVPLLRLARPGWAARPDAGAWTWVDSAADAVAAVTALVGASQRAGRPVLDEAPASNEPATDVATGRVLLAVGRQTLGDYAGLADLPVLARVADATGLDVPPAWEVLAARGPFTLESERALLRERGVTVLVTKDSGGAATSAKLDAAAGLGVAVVMIRRPAPPAGVPTVATVAEALTWATRPPDEPVVL